MYRQPIENETGISRRGKKKDKVVDIEDIFKSAKEDGVLSKYLRIRGESLFYEHPKIMKKEKDIFSYHSQVLDKDTCCLVCMDDISHKNSFLKCYGNDCKKPLIKGCCNQYYHVDCYFDWIESKHICPICKDIVMTIVNLKPSNGRYKVDSYRTSSYKCYDCYGNNEDKRYFIRRTKVYKVIYVHKKE